MERQASAQEAEGDAWIVNALYDFVKRGVKPSPDDFLSFWKHDNPKELIRMLAGSGIKLAKDSAATERYIKIARQADRHTDYSGYGQEAAASTSHMSKSKVRRAPFSGDNYH